MPDAPQDPPPLPQWASSAWLRGCAGLALFLLGFAAANRFQLTIGLTGGPWALRAGLIGLLVQAAALLGALLLLPGRWLAAALGLAAVSVIVNLGFSGILGVPLDAMSLVWIFQETRQAVAAATQFFWPALWAVAQAALVIALFLLARRTLMRGQAPRGYRRNLALGLVLLLAPSLRLGGAPFHPEAAERNLYGQAFDAFLAPPAPLRAAVALEPDTRGAPRHIVWVVDESVALAPFRRLIRPGLERWAPVDFGAAASIANCSLPANVALRAGVDVRSAGPRTDLRRMPSIWGYARKAGYHTVLIEGQTSGPMQNLMLAPERTLIDEVRSEATAGIDTDRHIAALLNRRLRAATPSFTYALLRGVHFQYTRHYPEGLLPPGSSMRQQYDAALTYSKRGFFEALLDGIDRSEVAVIYTSDHGQDFANKLLPHCGHSPGPEEFRIPLLAFLPDRLARRYARAPASEHAASQIFPATLIWMGYDPQAVQQAYDNDLTQATARRVWFGRKVVPLYPGDVSDVWETPAFKAE
jgi:hypothetical protein